MNKFYNLWKGSNLSTKCCSLQLLSEIQLAKARVARAVERLEKGQEAYFPVTTDFGVTWVDQVAYQAAMASDRGVGLVSVKVMDTAGVLSNKTVTPSYLYDGLMEEMDVDNLEIATLESLTALAVSEGDRSTAMSQILNISSRAATGAGRAFMSLVQSILERSKDLNEALANLLVSITPAATESRPFIAPTISSFTGTTGLSLWFDNTGAILTQIITEASQSIFKWFDDVADFAALYAPGAFMALTREVSYAIRSSFMWRLLRQGLPLACYFGDPGYLDPVIQSNDGTSVDDPSMNFTFGFRKYAISQTLKQAMLSAGCSDDTTYVLPTLGATWYFTLISDTTDLKYPGTFCYAPHLYEPQCASRLVDSLYYGRVSDGFGSYVRWSSSAALSFFEKQGYITVPFFKSFGEYISPGQLNDDVCSAYRNTGALIPYGIMMLFGDSKFSEFVIDNQRAVGSPSDVVLDGFLPTAETSRTLVSDVYQVTRSNALAYLTSSEVALSDPVLLWLDSTFTLYFYSLAEGSGDAAKAMFPVNETLFGAFTVMTDENYQYVLSDQAKSFAGTVAAVAAIAGAVALQVWLNRRYLAASRDYETAFYNASVDLADLRKLKRRRDFLFVASGVSLVQTLFGGVSQSSSETKTVVDDVMTNDIENVLPADKIDRIIYLINGSQPAETI